MPARVIFSTGSLYLYDLALVFELAAETGYDGIEVMGDDRYSSRDPDYLRRLAARYQLPVLVLHTPFTPRIPGWRDPHDEVRRIEQTLKLAESLAVESIVVHLPPTRDWLTLSLNQRSLRLPWAKLPAHSVKHWIEHQLPAVQAKTAVKIAIENMPSKGIIDPTWCNEVESWSKVHDWLTLDTTHWGTKKINPLDAYRAAAGRVAHVHLSNYDGKEHRLPHKGNLNLKAFLSALAGDDFGGTISLEVHPSVLEFSQMARVRKHMREAVEFCRLHLRQPDSGTKESVP
jgi:sugar phosphate isomerase/epimerase